MAAPTAFVGGTGIISHASNAPTYVAPAGHSFVPRPSNTYISPAGHTQPHEASSGKGIAIDSNA